MGAAWALSVVLVFAAWVAGYFLWTTHEPGFRSGQNLLIPIALVVIGVPLALLAAFLARRATRLWRVLGRAVVVADVFLVAYMVQWSHFGGVCLDPGDYCIVRPLTRVLGL